MRKDKLRIHLTKSHKIDVPKGKNEIDKYIDNIQNVKAKE